MPENRFVLIKIESVVNACSFDSNGYLRPLDGGCILHIVRRGDCNFTLGNPPSVPENCGNFASVKKIRDCGVRTVEGGYIDASLCEYTLKGQT